MPRSRAFALRPGAVAPWLLVATALATGATGVLGSLFGLTPAAAATMSVLLIAAILWISEAVPLFVTSFAVAFLNIVWVGPLLEEAETPVADSEFLAPFFSNVILLFLGGFVLSAGLRKYAIDERMARWVIGRTGGHPKRVLFGIMLATAFLSMWMSNTATTAMMLSLAIALLGRVPDEDPFRKSVLLGIPFAANLGGLGTPIGTPPNAIAIRYLEQSGADAPGFLGWLLLASPVLLLCLFLSYQLLLKLHPAGIERLALDEAPARPWSRRSRAVVAVTVATALGWLTSDLHPLSTGAVALVPVLVFFGARILSTDDFRSLSWDVLFIVGGGLSLGVAVDASGLGAWFVSLVPTGALGAAGLLVVLTVSAALMTSLMSNTATANLLIPVVVALPSVDTGPLLLGVAYACSVSMALPVSTPPNAMVFSSGMLTVRQLVVPGLVVSLLGVAAILLVGAPWWSLLLG